MSSSVHDLMWTSVWLTAILVAGLLALIFALRLRGRRRTETPTHPFSLGQLHSMRDRGEITEAEYQAMRGAVLRRLSDSKARPGATAPVSPPGPPHGSDDRPDSKSDLADGSADGVDD